MFSPRFQLVQKIHDVGNRLTPLDSDYKQWIFRFGFLELEKDLGDGDITTHTLFSPAETCSARLMTRETGILAGMQEVRYFLLESEPRFRPRLQSLRVNFLKNDGDRLGKNDLILELRGTVQDVLGAERVLVNLIARMSGVATLTRKFVDKIGDREVLMAATRKTLWGLLDKRAVCVGGGVSHRLNLSDAILVKDNHLALFKGDTTSLLEKCFSLFDENRFVEVEVESPEQAFHVASAMQRLHFKSATAPFFLLLDNMNPEKIREVVKILKENNFYNDVLLEASGGITLENVSQYTETGVDVLSSGALTTNARSLNLSLEVF